MLADAWDGPIGGTAASVTTGVGMLHNRWLIFGVIAVSAVMSASCGRAPVNGLEAVCWKEFDASFTSGVPTTRRFPLTSKSNVSFPLPLLGIIGCAACVSASWIVGGRESFGGDIVSAGDDVWLEIRYSGERTTGQYQYGVRLNNPDGSERVIPLNVRVHGRVLERGTFSLNSVAGTAIGITMDLPTKDLRVDVMADLGADQAIMSCVESQGEGDNGQRVWMAPAQTWQIMTAIGLDFRVSDRASPISVTGQVIGLPAFDVAVVPDGLTHEPVLRIRSRLATGRTVRVDPLDGETVSATRIWVAPGTTARVTLDRVRSGVASSLTVSCKEEGFERKIPIRW